ERAQPRWVRLKPSWVTAVRRAKPKRAVPPRPMARGRMEGRLRACVPPSAVSEEGCMRAQVRERTERRGAPSGPADVSEGSAEHAWPASHTRCVSPPAPGLAATAKCGSWLHSPLSGRDARPWSELIRLDDDGLACAAARFRGRGKIDQEW